MIISKFLIWNSLIHNFGLVMNNVSYTEKVCYNISIIDLNEKQKIKNLKLK